MSKQRLASCQCGQLTVTVQGDPVRVSMCHCHDCQRRTGSVFGVQARFAADQVSVSGESRTYLRTADSGGQAQLHFCPHCGSTVYFRLLAIPDTVVIPVGAFADASLPQPTISVYEERQHPWVMLPANIEHMF